MGSEKIFTWMKQYVLYHSYPMFLRFVKGFRRTHKLLVVGYSKCSSINMYHNPKDRAPKWPIPVTVFIFGILHAESDSKSDDSHEDGSFQIPNPCASWHFGDCEGQKGRQFRRFCAFMAFPPLPNHTMWGARNARHLTIYPCICLYNLS